MASKNSLLVVAIVLFHVCSNLAIEGRDLSKHSHDEYKLGGNLFTGSGPQSNMSIGRTTRSLIKEESDGYTHLAGYMSQGVHHSTWWHGVRARINIWNIPDVQPLSESSAYIAAINNLQGQEIVLAGVHVYPLMYNNSDLRFFTYWRLAGYMSQGVHHSTWWHGVRARINIWNIPDVQPLSESSAYIAAINNLQGQEIVLAGVHVYPLMYNNSDLRFFTYWRTTRDDIKGCYNDDCPGFVIANSSNLLPGQALSPLSKYDGEMRYITIRIKKDQKTGDWSLYREDLGGAIGEMTLLGWWPQSLFRSLSDLANIIQWSGEVYYQNNETSPSMGSGHFPSEGEGKAAYFYDCFGFDYDGTIYKDDYNPIQFTDRPECYSTSHWWTDSGKPGYQHFYYGGPSGCSK